MITLDKQAKMTITKTPKKKASKPAGSTKKKTASCTKKPASRRKVTPKARRTTASRARRPAKAPVERTVKLPELTVLTRFRNLPRQPRTYNSVVMFARQVSNGLKTEKYIDHKPLIKEIEIKLDDVKFMEKIEVAIKGAKIRFRVSFLAGTGKEKKKRKPAKKA